MKARARAAPWGADVVVVVGDGVGAPGAPPGPALQSSSKAKAAASSSRAKSAAKPRNNPPKHHSSQPQLHRPSSFKPGGGSGGMRKKLAEDSDDDQVRNWVQWASNASLKGKLIAKLYHVFKRLKVKM